MNRTLLLVTLLAAAAIALPAGAILTRADRDDEEYRELATRYPSAVGLGAAQGSGVLIAPRWVLTAAHRASALRTKNAALRIDGHSHEIQEVFVHPDWKPGGDSDIALVLLRTPVDGTEPTPIYRLSDEEGRTARIVGVGATGRIGQKASKPDGLPRAAINTVDRVQPLTLGMRLKSAEDASDLQGALAPGDGGAPAYFESDGRILVAGIASRTEDANADGIAGNIGDWEIYARVSAFAAWIDGVIARLAAEEAAAAVGDSERR